MRIVTAISWGMLLSCTIACSGRKNEPVSYSIPLPDKVDFNFHIKPILSDRCFKCHGPDDNAREADLRLDTREGAFAALGEDKDRFALVAGSPEKSQVYYRIYHDDPEEMMPPQESNLTLSEREKALITRWIEQGAEWKPHWSFIPVKRPKVPPVSDLAMVRNPIDHFVLKELEARELSLSPEADKERLIRRVSFDLTGLPPSIAEIDSFLADNSPNAYEKVVDRMLASQAYGERMAVEWMDLSRYADSHGYQDDGMRNIWPWRDWVIEKFNKNLPYDQFVTWQLAGDLLDDPSQEQILATAFNRNHLQSQEGGIVSEEYRVEYVADRTQTFAKAFLGLTLECARCHDHKYDPIKQKEYYQLYSFFNNNNEYGQIPYSGEAAPTVILTDKDTRKQLASLRRQIKAFEEKIQFDQPELQAGFEKWLGQWEAGKTQVHVDAKGPAGYYPLDKVQNKKTPNLADASQPAEIRYGRTENSPLTVAGKKGSAQQLVGESFFSLGGEIGKFERNQAFSIGLWMKILKDSTEGPIFSHSAGIYSGRRGYECILQPDRTVRASLNYVWPANGIEVMSLDPLPLNEWVQLTLTYDGSSRANGIHLFVNGNPVQTKILNDNLKKSILHDQNGNNWGQMAPLLIGKRFEETLEDVAVDEFMVFNHPLTRLEIAHYGGHTTLYQSLTQRNRNLRTDRQTQALKAFFVQHIYVPYQKYSEKLTELRGKENELLTPVPELMVMKELDESRPTFVLNRGQYDQPTKEWVDPGTPAEVMPFSGQFPNNRLGLAQWLFHPHNPLTARVVVNRFWQMYFGRGIVKTPDDFGNQGELPSHPALLDWLAAEFVAMGWDVKTFQKLIVMSATYRQSSKASPELLKLDPDNQWLARGPSFRLPAEFIRDHALASSGLLVRRIGGPSVKPYQPPGLWKQLATRNVTEYVQDHGDSLYRRSMYTVWKRTSPPPSMMNFDAPERNLCIVRRQNTSTPLQALVLMNDPQFIEASRMLAERMIKEADGDLDSQIILGFRLLTSRFPREFELEMLKKLYEDEASMFREEPERALKLLEAGEYPRDTSLEDVRLAALTMVATTMMNFDEAIMKR